MRYHLIQEPLREVGILSSRKRKATFSLPEEILAEVQLAVAGGAATSQNALVEKALIRELAEFRRCARRLQWEAAARDPQFLKDLQETESAFAPADAETARRIG